MTKRRITLADASFLLNESRETPMHVGGLTLYTLPKGVNETKFLQHLIETFRNVKDFRHPFGEVLEMSSLGPLGPVYLKTDDAIDIDYHIRHSALPKPGRFRELFELVSRLHSTLLDRSRPLWEFTIISGLPNRQFATYFKIHHSVIDGMGVIHFNKSMFSADPDFISDYSPFSRIAYERYIADLDLENETFTTETPTPGSLDILEGLYSGGRRLGTALNDYANSWLGRKSNLEVPWKNIPRTTINEPISGARRYVAQSWPFERVRTLSKATGGTLNDTILAMCAGALRRYLKEYDEIPSAPLKAMVPVSLRASNDADSTNAVSFFTANLATNIDDPINRLDQIRSSMQAAKEHLQDLKPKEVQTYTAVSQLPMLLLTLTGLTSRFPAFSTVISNVPGPRETMFLHKAKVDGLYPVSIPSAGFALNFTVVSYDKNLDFGITACRRSVPRVQKLIDFLEVALVELETAFDL